MAVILMPLHRVSRHPLQNCRSAELQNQVTNSVYYISYENQMSPAELQNCRTAEAGILVMCISHVI